MAKTPFISKASFKKRFKRCAICHENNYDTLDVHRWKTFGCDGGKYSSDNSIVLCVKCHRLVHKNKITIEGIYPSTNGNVVIYKDENKKEKIQEL